MIKTEKIFSNTDRVTNREQNEMLTIKEMIDDLSNIDEGKLAEISDKVWKLGSLDEIKEKVSPALFYLHVGMNIIGCWKCDGWWFIICEQADLVPYIPMTLDKLNLPELKVAFENVIALFPEYTVFKSDDNAYYDICNFLQSASIKVHDERLRCIAPDKRKEMVKRTRQNLNMLEDLTEQIFNNDLEYEGWKPIIDYIRRLG